MIPERRSLERIREEIERCTLCPLHETRERAVPGEGPDRPRVMLIGEGPGREEDLTGKPFVGRSGKLLTEVLLDAGMNREDVFITSVVKCRPPKNRNPKSAEFSICIQAHLNRQIAVLNPKVIVLLGGVAAKAILGEKNVSEIRGRSLNRDGRVFFPTYHPAAALRNPKWKKDLISDLHGIDIRAKTI